MGILRQFYEWFIRVGVRDARVECADCGHVCDVHRLRTGPPPRGMQMGSAYVCQGCRHLFCSLCGNHSYILCSVNDKCPKCEGAVQKVYIWRGDARSPGRQDASRSLEQPQRAFQTADQRLLQAAAAVDVVGVRNALRDRANPNVRECSEGQTALHLCIRSRESDPKRFVIPVENIATIQCYRPVENIATIVDVLLKAGTDVNAVDNDGISALHWASHYNLVGVINALLRAGADVQVADKVGMTPLHQAARSHLLALEATEALIRAGANVNKRTNGGLTPLYYAEGT